MHIRKITIICSIIALVGIISCAEEKVEKNIVKRIIEVNCDLENSNEKEFICSNGIMISGASRKSEEVARSGKTSVKISSNRNYALHYRYAPIELGDEIIVSVWRYRNNSSFGALTISTGKQRSIYIGKSVKTSGDWELLKKHIKINRELSDSLLDIFVFNNNKQPAYFDDLQVIIVKNGGYTVVDHPELIQLHLEVKPKNMAKLKEKRIAALKTKVLISESDDWVKAKVNWDYDSEKCKIRLKGDWTDHLVGKKWSLRVNVLDSKKVGGYNRFSIQNPSSRGYLLEWFSHKILIDEGVLTTRFDFVNFNLNGELKGLYSIEEHFTDELLLSQNRKKGVIIKFDENPMWIFRSEHHKKKEGSPQWYTSAEIIPFGSKKIKSDELLLNNFLKSRDMLNRFQHRYGAADQVFDLDKMAKFLALVDVFKAYHGLIWHNLRFYYNEDTEKLEPIAYDLFTEDDPPESPYPGLIGYNFLSGDRSGLYFEFRFLFTSIDFINKYIAYLELYSSPGFLEDQLDKYKSELNFYQKEIQKEYRFYKFESQFIIENARMIREKLPEFIRNKEKLIPSSQYKGGKIDPNKLSYKPVNNQSLKVYNSILNSKVRIQFRNFYYRPIIITGYIISDDTLQLNNEIKLEPYLQTKTINTTSISTAILIDQVLYRVDGETETFTQNAIPFRAPE